MCELFLCSLVFKAIPLVPNETVDDTRTGHSADCRGNFQDRHFLWQHPAKEGQLKVCWSLKASLTGNQNGGCR